MLRQSIRTYYVQDKDALGDCSWLMTNILSPLATWKEKLQSFRDSEPGLMRPSLPGHRRMR